MFEEAANIQDDVQQTAGSLETICLNTQTIIDCHRYPNKMTEQSNIHLFYVCQSIGLFQGITKA